MLTDHENHFQGSLLEPLYQANRPQQLELNMSNQKERFATLHARVIAWSNAKGLKGKATPIRQWHKTKEEQGEAHAAFVRGDREKLKDALGDIVVTLIIGKQLVTDDGADLPHLLWGHLIGLDKSDPDLWFMLLDVNTSKVGQTIFDRQTAIDESHEEEDIADLTESLVESYDHAVAYTETLASHCGFDLNDCLEMVLEIIEQRTGKMENGVFIKDGEKPT